ncbi:MAG: HPP family protein, partial [Desulfovibrio piger]
MLIGSFGASAVLLFAAPDSPLSRPRNLLGGHFFS